MCKNCTKVMIEHYKAANYIGIPRDSLKYQEKEAACIDVYNKLVSLA